MAHYQVLVIGGGAAGLTVAARLRNQENPLEVAVVEPSDKHYYQPIWTLVGAGVFDKSVSEKDEAEFMPDGVTWIKDYCTGFNPEGNSVSLKNGEDVTYDYLVVTAGIQIDWDKIPGLKESVGKPGSGVCSNYSFETVGSTWENIKNLKSGNAIFTQPATPIKCGGAPQKIMYLASHHFQKSGVKGNIDVKFMSAGGGIFAVPKYASALNKVVERYGIDANYGHNLVAIDADKKVATFEVMATGDKIEVEYGMIHVTPPQSSPDFIKNSSIANEGGWVDVDGFTTQHKKFNNIFSIGDASGIPTSKTGAAIRKQAPTLVANLLATMQGKPMPKSYDGYTSCPLVTGYGSLILAEFGFNAQVMESFPFDQAQERYSMYALKAYALPQMYWHGMLRGRDF